MSSSPSFPASVSREYCVRPGVDLAWAAGLPPTRLARAGTVARFSFILADGANPEIDRMVISRGPETDACGCAAAACAFSVTVEFSRTALEELLLDDAAPGAAPLREFLASATSSTTLPLTPSARLAVESIRRCPFTGAYRAMALTSRCNDLVLELLTALAAASARAAPVLRSVQEQIQAAAGLLAELIEEPPTLLALARQVGLSETTLKRGFHQVFGTTVFGYLRARRMERAHALLKNGEATVLEAAARVGYSNPSNFATAFRRQFGVNPKEFQLAARR